MEDKKETLWLPCPSCKRRTTIRVLEESTLIHFPLYCKWCRKEFIVTVVQKKMTLEKEVKE